MLLCTRSIFCAFYSSQCLTFYYFYWELQNINWLQSKFRIQAPWKMYVRTGYTSAKLKLPYLANNAEELITKQMRPHKTIHLLRNMKHLSLPFICNCICPDSHSKRYCSCDYSYCNLEDKGFNIQNSYS